MICFSAGAVAGGISLLEAAPPAACGCFAFGAKLPVRSRRLLTPRASVLTPACRCWSTLPGLLGSARFSLGGAVSSAHWNEPLALVRWPAGRSLAGGEHQPFTLNHHARASVRTKADWPSLRSDGWMIWVIGRCGIDFCDFFAGACICADFARARVWDRRAPPCGGEGDRVSDRMRG